MPVSERVRNNIERTSERSPEADPQHQSSAFAHHWLPAVLPAEEAASLATIPTSYVVDLYLTDEYEDVYIYGPNIFKLRNNLAKILGILKNRKLQKAGLRTKMTEEFMQVYGGIHQDIYGLFKRNDSFNFETQNRVISEGRGFLVQTGPLASSWLDEAYAYHLVPEIEYGRVKKSNFIHSLTAYCSYMLIMNDGITKPQDSTISFSEHVEFAKKWGLEL